MCGYSHQFLLTLTYKNNLEFSIHHLRYGFLNVVLHHVNFKMLQHAIKRTSHARKMSSAVPLCGAYVGPNMLNMPESAYEFNLLSSIINLMIDSQR